ncbi:FeoA domain-containing protein [bacterium]|nr:FeoA domain-containing protein [bacterium]
MQIGFLSESLEDYLEVIFRLLQKQKVARVRDIANLKDVKTSSVVSALQRLAKEGLVDYKAREYVDLTPAGRQLAFRLYQRHTFLKRFLTDFLQVDHETAETDACSMEHAISVTTLDRITAMSEFLSYSPDVEKDLIDGFRDRWLAHLHKQKQGHKDSDGENGKDGIVALSSLKAGQSGYIIRIAAADDLRLSLIRRGVLPGASIHLLEKLASGSLMVRLAGERMELQKGDAKAVLIRPQVERSSDTAENGETVRTLADMTPGCAFRVKRVTSSGEIRARMNDMGFIRGAEGRILREALLRDPIEVELAGTLLSLRRLEATTIVVEELDA